MSRTYSKRPPVVCISIIMVSPDPPFLTRSTSSAVKPAKNRRGSWWPEATDGDTQMELRLRKVWYICQSQHTCCKEGSNTTGACYVMRFFLTLLKKMYAVQLNTFIFAFVDVTSLTSNCRSYVYERMVLISCVWQYLNPSLVQVTLWDDKCNAGYVLYYALDWNPQGKRRRGRLKKTWKRTVKEEARD
jgi:hypothetical protein